MPIVEAGLGWIINFVGSYYRPELGFGFTTAMVAGELMFMA